MTTTEAAEVGAIPVEQPRIRKMRWPFPFIWLVPLAAAIYAGYLFFGQFQEFGDKITVTFQDANGLVIDQSPVRFRGVDIGKVVNLEFTEKFNAVITTIRLKRSANELARKGTQFWVVRPELGEGNFVGLGTFISGPYIEVIPGKGDNSKQFAGLDKQPANLGHPGLTIRVRSSHISYLKSGSPIYFRGIQVGLTESAGLSPDGSMATIDLFIDAPYQRLVRTNSKFWSANGLDLNGSLLGGLELKVDSLRSLVFGGISFATPDEPGDQAKEGSVFELHDKAKDEWLDWSPSIKLPAQSVGPGGRTLDDEKAILNSGTGKKVP